MSRISTAKTAIFLVAASSLVAAFGCHLIAGIEGKTEGAGGAGTSSTGGTESTGSFGTTGSMGMMSTGSFGSTGSGPMMCDPGPGSSARSNCSTSCNDANPPMADACHCAKCKLDCGNEGVCTAGRCQAVLATEVPGYVYAMTTNGFDIFFASTDDTASPPKTIIYKLALDASSMAAAIPISGSFEGRVKAMSAGCNAVFFAIGATQNENPRIAYLWPSDNNTVLPRGILPPEARVDDVVAVAADREIAFWAANGGDSQYRGVKAVRIGGAGVIPVADHPSQPLTDLVVRDGFVYWSAGDAGGKGFIMRANLMGMPPWGQSSVKAEGGWPISIAVAGDSVYWVEWNSNPAQVWMGPRDGTAGGIMLGPLSTSTMSGLTSYWLDADDDDLHVYAINDSNNVGFIARFEKGKTVTSPEVYAKDTTYNAQALVMDERRVYFAHPAEAKSRIYWVAK